MTKARGVRRASGWQEEDRRHRKWRDYREDALREHTVSCTVDNLRDGPPRAYQLANTGRTSALGESDGEFNRLIAAQLPGLTMR